MFDSIIGSIFFEFIGASVKWLYSAILCTLKGKKILSFRDIWDGKKGAKYQEAF